MSWPSCTVLAISSSILLIAFSIQLFRRCACEARQYPRKLGEVVDHPNRLILIECLPRRGAGQNGHKRSTGALGHYGIDNAVADVESFGARGLERLQCPKESLRIRLVAGHILAAYYDVNRIEQAVAGEHGLDPVSILGRDNAEWQGALFPAAYERVSGIKKLGRVYHHPLRPRE